MSDKIGIIDTDHYFYIYSLISIYSVNNNQIVVYTTPKIYQRCQIDLKGKLNIAYKIQKENESWPDFIMRNADEINADGFDYFYILPIYNFYKEHYHFIRRLKTFNILVVFNLNGWINPSLISFRWFRNSWYKRKIINKIKWIAIDEHFHNHALSLGCKNNIVHIPSLLFDPSKYNDRERGEKIKFIYPGSIDNRRRDYSIVFNAILKLLDHSQNFEVVLLGDPIGKYGNEIIQNALSINEKYKVQIFKCYPNGYTDEEFVSQISDGDILVTSIIKVFELDGIVEIYGESKSTGSCFDILAYAIPGIFPDWLSINSRFDSSTIRYKNTDDLYLLLKSLVNEPERVKCLRKVALENSMYYSIENVRSRLMNDLSFINNKSEQ